MTFVPINQSNVPAVGSAVRLTKLFLSYLTGTAREMPVPLRKPACPTSVQVLPHQGPSSVKVIVIIERTLRRRPAPGTSSPPGLLLRAACWPQGQRHDYVPFLIQTIFQVGLTTV
jgi:hypothetical protein